MQTETAQFGELEVPEEAILSFPWGLIGFPEICRCFLLAHGAVGGLRWLQPLNRGELVFLTVEPHLVFPDYEIDLPAGEAAALGLRSPGEAAVLSLITIAAESEAVTANLLAPIIINTRERRGRQVILDDDRYLTKHLIGGEIKDTLYARADAQTG